MLFVALSGVDAQRKLDEAIPLLLERASYGDFGEMMRGLRHALEAIVKPAWTRLAKHCVTALAHPRRGTRLWAADELGVLREPSTVPALLAALDDDATRVRTAACTALGRIAREHPKTRRGMVARVRWYAERRAEYFESERWSDEVVCAIEALGEIAIGDARTVALLRGWTNGDDVRAGWLQTLCDQRRAAANAALAKLGRR